MVASLGPFSFCGRPPGRFPRQAPMASSTLASPSGKALPGATQGPSLKREGRDKASCRERSVHKKDPIPSGGRESLQGKASPLAGRKRRTREGLGHVPKVKDAMHVARESRGEIPCLPQERAWRTRDGSPLRQTCRRHHYHSRRGNDGQDQLVESH
jgi:hypothetical protein